MRLLRLVLCVSAFAVSFGCSQMIGEKKEPIALENVPANILEIAQKKYPEVVFDTAFTEIEDGQSVFELKGKSKSGKIYEVEVTKDGTILE